MSYGQRIRDRALSYPETYEDSPWGHPVFKVGDNKMFAAMSDGDASVTLTVKLTPEEREIALHFPHVSVARYVGRYGWVTAQVFDDETLESALEWLRESYWLKAPRGCVTWSKGLDSLRGATARAPQSAVGSSSEGWSLSVGSGTGDSSISSLRSSSRG